MSATKSAILLPRPCFLFAGASMSPRPSATPAAVHVMWPVEHATAWRRGECCKAGRQWREDDTAVRSFLTERREVQLTDANIGKTSEVGKAELEHFDVEEAIKEVRRLGKGLIEATRHAKHHFREEWLEQLIDRYRRLPGKPVIHLDDLSDAVIPTLSPQIRDVLFPHWKRLVEEFGYMGSMNRFRCLRDIVAGARVTQWSMLGTWRRLTRLTDFRVNEMEPYVTAIRASSVGTTRVILRPKLPFSLATSWGAKIIGYRGDAAHDNSAFHNLEPILHKDYKQAITETVGNVPFTTSIRQIDGYERTNVGTFVTLLTSIAGIDNTKRQKKARNPLPSWFFLCNDTTLTNGLRALWDAEGSPTIHALQLGQAAGLRRINTQVDIPEWDTRISVNRLEKSAQEQIGRRPPLLLVSTALLLYRLGIRSYMGPAMTAQTQHAYSVYWNLCIYRTKGMRLFEQRINFLSVKQRRKLHQFNLLHKPQHPSSPPFFS